MTDVDQTPPESIDSDPWGLMPNGAGAKSYANGAMHAAGDDETSEAKALAIRNDPVLLASAAVLSAVMVDPFALAKVSGLLRAEHFHSEADRQTFAACVALAARGEPVDIVTVSNELKERGRIAQVGGLPYLTIVLNAAPAVANVVTYAEIVRGAWNGRQARRISQTAAAQLADGIDATSVIETMRANLARVETVEVKPRDVVVVGGDELAEALPPLIWRCAGLKLTSGAHTTVAGNAFSGKSLALQDLAVAVASGSDVWGTFAVARGAARWLDYDGQGRRVTQERFQRLARARGVDLRELGAALGYVRNPPFFLDDDDAGERLSRLLDGVALCVIDSWRGATPGTNEWSRAEVQRVAAMLEQVSTVTGCVVKVVDHNVKPPRDAGGTRSTLFDMHGSTAKSETAQSHFVFTGEEGRSLTRVQHKKERVTGQPIADFALRFEDVAQQDDPRWGLRVVHVDRAEQPAKAGTEGGSRKFDELKASVLATVRDNPSLTSRNAICARVTGGGKDVKLEAIRELEAEGHLGQPGGEGSAFRVTR